MSKINIESLKFVPTFQRKILNCVECLCMCNAEVNGSGAQFSVRATNITYSDVLFYHQV